MGARFEPERTPLDAGFGMPGIPWVPLQLGAGVALRADAGVTMAGSDVATWANQSASPWLASVAALADGGTRRAEKWRGKDAIWLELQRLQGAFGAVRAQPSWMLFVGTPIGVSTQTLSDGVAAARHAFLALDAAYPRKISYFAGSTRSVDGLLVADHQPEAWLARIDGASSVLYRWQSGAFAQIDAGNVGVLSWDGLTLGGSTTSANARVLLAEFCAGSGVLPSADIDALGRYVRARYGLNAEYRRICPVGDSLTVGQGATDGKGWRRLLRDEYKLTKLGGRWVASVGSQASAKAFPDDTHGGRSGLPILGTGTDLRTNIALETATLPHVTVLLAGTNDCRNNTATYDPVLTPAEYALLVGDIHTALPGRPIVVATIPPLQNVAHDANVSHFNNELRNSVWDTLSGSGVNLFRVDLHADVFGSAFNPGMFADGVHPNDAGHTAMAAALREGIAAALAVT